MKNKKQDPTMAQTLQSNLSHHYLLHLKSKLTE